MRHVVGDVPLGGSPFPPIADYAFLSDCEVCALVAPSGNVEWMCLPRFDGPSVFATMLDRDAGSFRLAPVDTSVPAGQRYLPGTMVLETTWGTRTGWVIVRDVLLVGPWHHDDERSHTHRRSPTDNDADHVLLRTLRCVNGRVEMHMECEPRVDYGRKAVQWEYAGPGYGKAVGRAEGEALELTLTTDLRIGFEGGRARARTTLRDGDTAFIALSWSDHGGPETYDEAYHRLVYTADYWHEWLSHGEFPDHPWRTYLQRSALTLKGLTYAPTGAMIAAATTSLPETPGGERNWDYRYAWIRDSTFMLWGLYTLGFDEEANDFFYFIRDVASKSDGEMQIMYGIGGEETLTEEMLLTTSTATSTPSRCASATAPTRRGSTTSGARCWTRCTCTRSRATGWPSRPGRSSRSRSTTRSPPGASPTAASGRSAASRSTSPRRRSCAGSPATAARGWRACARTTSAASAGSRRPTRSTPTSARTGSTSAARSRSTTTPRRSTPRACSSRSCASCRPTTSA